METFKKIEFAVELLKELSGYVGYESKTAMTTKFDFQVDGGDIRVYNANPNNTTFYWESEMVHIVEALNLSCYVSFEPVTFGVDKYGNEIQKSVIVFRIY